MPDVTVDSRASAATNRAGKSHTQDSLKYRASAEPTAANNRTNTRRDCPEFGNGLLSRYTDMHIEQAAAAKATIAC